MMALWRARGGSLNKESYFSSWHCGRQGGAKFKQRIRFKMMALWKARGGNLNEELDLR